MKIRPVQAGFWPGKRIRLGLFAATLTGVAGQTPAARAQLIQQYFPDDLPGFTPQVAPSVLDRMYIQQTPPGVEAGDDVIRPKLTETTGYDSNTLGEAGSASSTLESDAGIEVDSDWERDALSLNFDLDDHRYFNVPSASYTNWQAGAKGSVLLGNDSLKYSYAHSAFNLAATDLGVIGVTTPVGYSVDDATLAYVKRFSRFSLTPGLELENFAFGRATGQTALNENTIDHRTALESITGGYEATPGNALIGVLRSSQAQFPHAPQDGYLDLAGFAGIDFTGDGILQSRALLGVESRNFNGIGLKTATIPTFEVALAWMPTRLDSITATGIRRLDDPVSPFALDSILLEGRLSVDHELRRDLFLSATAQAEQSDAQTSEDFAAEKQTQLSFGASFVWDLRRNVTASLSYDFNKTASRSSGSRFAGLSGAYPNFSSHSILIGVEFYE